MISKDNYTIQEDLIASFATNLGVFTSDQCKLIFFIIKCIHNNTFSCSISIDQFISITDNLELSLSDKEICAILKICKFLDFDGKSLSISSIPTVRTQIVDFANKFLSVITNEPRQQDNVNFIFATDIASVLMQTFKWASDISEYALHRYQYASPVFWKYSRSNVEPIADPCGSFATSTLAALSLGPVKYGFLVSDNITYFPKQLLMSMIKRSIIISEELKGGISLLNFDDDYPGSEGVSHNNSNASFPTVNTACNTLAALSLFNTNDDEVLSYAQLIFNFIKNSQFPNGSWSIRPVYKNNSIPEQVLSTIFAIESFSQVLQQPNFVLMHEETLECSIKCIKFIENVLLEGKPFDHKFSTDTISKSSNYSDFYLVLASCILELKQSKLGDFISDEVLTSIFNWYKLFSSELEPNWKNVIKIPIPVPTWSGGISPTSFNWEYPRDPFILRLLCGILSHNSTHFDFESLHKHINKTLSAIIASQKDGMWKDVPMAITGKDRGFPQVSEACTRSLLYFLKANMLHNRISFLDY